MNSKRESNVNNNPAEIEGPNFTSNSNLKKENLAIYTKLDEDSSELKDNIAPLTSLTQLTENMIISQRTHDRQLEFIQNLNNNQINLSLISQISIASLKDGNEVEDVSNMNMDNYVNFTINEEAIQNETNQMNEDVTNDVSNNFNKEKKVKMFKLDSENVDVIVAGENVFSNESFHINREDVENSKSSKLDDISNGKFEEDEILDVIQ